MKNLIVLILFLFAYQSTFAQPGGGGGLYIKNFYDSSLQKIEVSDFDFRFQVDTMIYDWQQGFILEDFFFIPPNNSYSDNQSLITLEIDYKNKKYKIDIENICPENGGGASEYMDSLVLDRPYILSKRAKDNGMYKYMSFMHEFAKPLLQNGITPHTNKELNLLGYTHFSSDYINDEKKLPWEENFYKAVKENDTTYLVEAIKENHNQYNAPMLNFKLRFLEVEEKEQEIDKSQAMLDLINSNPTVPLMTYFEDIKAKSLIKLQRYDEAVKEYIELEQKYADDSIKELKYKYKKNKVKFYLGNYDAIIQDFYPLCKDINSEYFENIPWRGDYVFEELNEIYFLYSFSLFAKNPTLQNKERLHESIYTHRSTNYKLDARFLNYLTFIYYMNTPMTEEKFEGFQLIYKLRLEGITNSITSSWRW